MNIKEMIYRDFGISVPLEKGTGRRDDPFVITAHDPMEYSIYQTRLLTGLGKGRKLYWRIMGREIIEEGSALVEKLKQRTIELTETQKHTTEEAYYFDISHFGRKIPEPSLPSPSLPISFPMNIGWLHYTSGTNYENVAPGQGVSANYDAPNITATVYVYDKRHDEIPNDVNDPLVREEFEDICRDVCQRFPNAEAWPDRDGGGLRLTRIYKIDSEATQVTSVTLTTANNHFVKIRLTWMRDYDLDDFSLDFLYTVLALFGRVTAQ